MIGIPKLDRLSTEDMMSIINGELRILVQDPRKIQTAVGDIDEPKLHDEQFMDNNTVITMLKMEVHDRLCWEYVRQEIKKEKMREMIDSINNFDYHVATYFECCYCDEIFRRKGNIVKHLKSHKITLLKSKDELVVK